MSRLKKFLKFYRATQKLFKNCCHDCKTLLAKPNPDAQKFFVFEFYNVANICTTSVRIKNYTYT